jgi:rare lipoprotein A
MRVRRLLLLGVASWVLASCATGAGSGSSGGSGSSRSEDTAQIMERGTASWYGEKFQGRRTASGERFDMNDLTAAHRTLPFGTRVRVRSVVTGREVVVRINDRGPSIRSRIIDLSQSAADALGVRRLGVFQVELLRE